MKISKFKLKKNVNICEIFLLYRYYNFVIKINKFYLLNKNFIYK